MCKDLTAYSAVGYRTPAVRIVSVCVQIILLVVLYGTVMQQ